MVEQNPSFELNLLFDGNKQAVDVFNELGNIFQSVHEFDKWILSHIDSGAFVYYTIEGIEFGSIRTRLAQFLRAIPDDAIKSLDWKALVGNLLLKTKYLILKALEQNKTIDSKAILETLTTEINSELSKLEENSNQIIIPQINIYILLNNIETISRVVNSLPNKEAIEYRSKFGDVKLSRGIYINKSKIIHELGATTVTNDTTEILKIKKIGLLSDEAKWDFKIGSRVIHARIQDLTWLNNYHKREIIIKPEDSLKVTLKTTYTFTNNNEHTQLAYDIVKVLQVITPDIERKNPNLFTGN